ncbi:MAG: PEGA domain-containing protein [Planctomycetota bacterium]|nr:PEGA domain-containing protein [Planctomycetota bacterium]
MRRIKSPVINPRSGVVSCTLIILLASCGCVERTLTVTSNPPGALVYLNDQEIGRTPLKRDFVWYGTYDVVLRKEGFRTVKAAASVIAPFYEWVPFDLVAEILPIPLKVHRNLNYVLTPEAPTTQSNAELLDRATEFRGQLQSSHYPPTQPASQPVKTETK